MKDAKRLVLFYLDQLNRRRWLAIAFAWGVCILGWVAVAFMPNRYVSEARFYVDTTTLLNPLLRGISVNSDDKTRDQEVAVMQRTLTSRPNLTRVAQMTDLDKAAKSEAQLQALINKLEDRIAITSQGPNLFLVQYSDNSPETARSVVQALLTIFVESSVGNKREDIQTAKSFIETQIADYEGQLKTAEAKLADFKVKNIGFFSSNSQTFAARLEGAREGLESAKTDYQDAVAQRDALNRQLNSTPRLIAVDAASPFAANGQVQGTSLQQRIRALQTKLEELRLQYTDKHPDVIATQEQLKRLTAPKVKGVKADAEDIDTPAFRVPNDVYAQLSMKVSDAETRVASSKHKLEEAERIFNDLQQKASEAPRVEAEFTNLNRDYEVLKASYEGLLQRRESARIAQAADSTTEPVQFRVIAAPELPARPTGPKRTIFNTIVLILGIAAGAGFVVLLTTIEDHVATADDLAEIANVPILGSISTVTSLERREAAERKPDRFKFAAAGLVAVFLFVVVVGPNFASVADRFSMWLS